MAAKIKVIKCFLFRKETVAFSLLLLFCIQPSFAQKGDTSRAQNTDGTDTGKVLIHVLNNDYGEFVQGEGRSVQKLMYNVKLRYGSDTLYCDSAFFYTRENSVEAFGDVAIYEADGTKAFAEYMRYTSRNQLVYMRSRESDVELDDGKGNILWSKEVYYQLQSKLGSFNRGGTLQSGSTIVSSDNGNYNLRTKDARFRKNVVVSDPQYYIRSSDLGYNTRSKIVTFFDSSTVNNNESILKTRSGFYNTLDSTALFTKRSAIWNGSQFIEADTLDYSHQAGGIAFAKGRVIAVDTTQNITLFSQAAQFQEQENSLLAYGAPLLRTVHGKDTLHLKADTFYSAPAMETGPSKDSTALARKSLQQTVDEIRQQVHSADTVPFTDTLPEENLPPLIQSDSATAPHDSLNITTDSSLTVPLQQPPLNDSEKSDSVLVSAQFQKEKDTTLLPLQHQKTFDSLNAGYQNRPAADDTSRPRYFIGYYHVRMFSDSLQGYCDSIRYNQVDSLLRMYGKPLLWPNNSQVAGKEIYLKLDSNRLRELIVPEEGILINRSGPEKAGMFNQIQGNVINGYFKDNQLQQLIAAPHASSIYYVVNDAGEYVGCSEASSRQIEILFNDSTGKVDKLFYRQDVQQKMTPMMDVQPETMRLSRFQWQEALRPKDLESFLEGTSLPHEPDWK